VRLELTESLLVRDPGLAKPLLRELRRAGVSLAIDDFGTGYSSLRTLCDFPFDTLKIDKSFVDGIPDDEDAARVVRSIAALARELQMTVVAEGVENDAQAQRLAELGCGYGQGYRFAKPASRAETLELLRSATTW
jgi:EAL domain-containing protein (putative c-di-GMP-specific phosphodiesterase class I)